MVKNRLGRESEPTGFPKYAKLELPARTPCKAGLLNGKKKKQQGAGVKKLAIRDAGGGEVEDVLATLREVLVMDIEDYRDIYCEGDKYKASREIKKMVEEGIVRTAAHPEDGRKRCMILTMKGARELGLDVETSRQVIKKEQLGWGIAKSKLYLRLGQAGIPLTKVLSRKEALEKYRLRPNETILAWVLEEPGPYVLYVPWKTRYKSRILQSINKTEGQTKVFRGHILVHEMKERWRQDRRRFLNDSPAGQFYLMTYEHLGLLKKGPGEMMREVEEMFQIIAPGGRLKATFPGSPLDMAYERKGEMLVGDMRMEDITLAARVMNLTQERIEGYNGVTLVMRDEAQAKDWAKIFGGRSRLWYLTENTLGLYRYDGRRLVMVGGRTHERVAR